MCNSILGALQAEQKALDTQLIATRKRFYTVNEFLLGNSPPTGWREAMHELTTATKQEDVVWALNKLQDIWERETNLTGI